MALTALIECDDRYKNFFKEVIPRKKDFKTISGHIPFSKEYIELAPYRLSNPYNSGLVGTAFDYIARWMTARIVNLQKEDSYIALMAESGIPICKIEANRKGINIQKKYDKGIEICKKFIQGGDNIQEVICTAIFFAKLEQIFRRQLNSFQVDIDNLLCIEDEAVEDLIKLSHVFKTNIIDRGIITENSVVVYNPSFGGASVICGGADADIFIDGTLYDFKCTKKTGYAWNEVAQILGYFFLCSIAKKNNDADNKLKNFEINRIAFYRARYGEVEYVDIDTNDYVDTINQFEKIIGEEAYKRYFEEERRQLEQERIRIEEEQRKEEECKVQCEQLEPKYIKLLSYTNNEYLLKQIEKYDDVRSRLFWMEAAITTCYNIRITDKIDGKKLKNLLELKGITDEELSKLLGKTQLTIRNWLNEKSNPTAGTIIDMTEIFNCQINDIIKTEKSSTKMKTRWRTLEKVQQKKRR